MADEVWQVFVVEYATAVAQPAASLVLGDTGAPLDVPYAFVLARAGGRVVLIDTGFLADAGGGQHLARTYGISPWVHPLRMLGALGLGAPDVSDIVLTHLHFDHVGAARTFPRARLHLQKRELLFWVEALALPPRFGFLTESLDPDDLHALIAAASQRRLHLLDGDCHRLLPGLDARLAADSHTCGSQYVALETARGRVVVAGDCIYSRANLAPARADGRHVPLGYGMGGMWGQIAAMERICAEVDDDLSRIVLLHDPRRWPEGQVIAELESMRVIRVA